MIRVVAHSVRGEGFGRPRSHAPDPTSISRLLDRSKTAVFTLAEFLKTGRPKVLDSVADELERVLR